MGIKYEGDSLLFRVAECAMEEGRYDEAISIYSQLIKKHNASELYLQRSVALVGTGNLQDGLKDIDRAIELKPSDPDCYLNRGNIYIRLKKFEFALHDFGIAKSLGLTSPKLYNSLGYTLYKLKRNDEAIDALWASLSLDSSYASPVFNLGLLAGSMGDLKQSATYLEKAVAMEPENLKFRQMLEKVQRLLGI